MPGHMSGGARGYGYGGAVAAGVTELLLLSSLAHPIIHCKYVLFYKNDIHVVAFVLY
jgi:hypothetical protein